MQGSCTGRQEDGRVSFNFVNGIDCSSLVPTFLNGPRPNVFLFVLSPIPLDHIPLRILKRNYSGPHRKKLSSSSYRCAPRSSLYSETYLPMLFRDTVRDPLCDPLFDFDRDLDRPDLDLDLGLDFERRASLLLRYESLVSYEQSESLESNEPRLSRVS